MKSLFALAYAIVLSTGVFAQTIYNNQPDWISSDTAVSTGAALVDINRDGWVDLVVANGNDMQQQRVVVYYNNGSGAFPATASWRSNDQQYNGHLDVADVNQDGWPDVAVAVLGNGATHQIAAKVYLNNNGTLSSTPDWQSQEIANAFGCCFGDVNNDGWPDLAVATGWSYNPQYNFKNYVYLNNNGTLSSSASWQSDDTYHYQGVLWIDADNDGWLDLLGVAGRTNSRIYRNLGGVLETTASWSTTDSPNQDGIMATAGDVNGDGIRDLFQTDNTQLGGSGRHRQYTGLPGGFFQTTYSWSYYDGYGSAVALADLNNDGKLDLMTGGWWLPTRMFLNTGSGLPNTPNWTSTRTSVIEKIYFSDINRDGLLIATETFAGDGLRRLFYLGRQPIMDILAVEIDGQPGDFEYTFSREQGWITVSAAPLSSLRVEYLYSTRLDMAVTNWDSTLGNFVYYHQYGCAADLDGDGDTDLADLATLLGDYGCVGICVGDIDSDGDTDIADLAYLLSDYGCE